jgi:hypothetical protein
MESYNAMDAEIILKNVQQLGVTLTLVGNKIRYTPKSQITSELLEELKEHRSEILSKLRQEQNTTVQCWILEEWRQTSLPSWRRILKESVEQNNKNREEYARWMLKEVLEDPEYKENDHD